MNFSKSGPGPARGRVTPWLGFKQSSALRRAPQQRVRERPLNAHGAGYSIHHEAQRRTLSSFSGGNLATGEDSGAGCACPRRSDFEGADPTAGGHAVAPHASDGEGQPAVRASTVEHLQVAWADAVVKDAAWFVPDKELRMSLRAPAQVTFGVARTGAWTYSLLVAPHGRVAAPSTNVGCARAATMPVSRPITRAPRTALIVRPVEQERIAQGSNPDAPTGGNRAVRVGSLLARLFHQAPP